MRSFSLQDAYGCFQPDILHRASHREDELARLRHILHVLVPQPQSFRRNPEPDDALFARSELHLGELLQQIHRCDDTRHTVAYEDHRHLLARHAARVLQPEGKPDASRGRTHRVRLQVAVFKRGVAQSVSEAESGPVVLARASQPVARPVSGRRLVTIHRDLSCMPFTAARTISEAGKGSSLQVSPVRPQRVSSMPIR